MSGYEFHEEEQNPFEETEGEYNQAANKYDPAGAQQMISSLNKPWVMTSEGLTQKEQELKIREENLRRREEMLLERERQLGRERNKNWPRFYPILYHNIVEDMPTPELVTLVKRAYWTWYAIIGVLFISMVGLLSYMIEDGSGENIASFFLCLLYLLLSIPLGFLVYRVLYNAARKAKPAVYFIWFIFLWFEVLVFAFFALGYPGFGCAGIITAIGAFNDDKVVSGGIVLTSGILWICMMIVNVYLFFLARPRFREAGGIQKAKEEAATVAAKEMAKHPDLVAQAATGAATGAVANQQ